MNYYNDFDKNACAWLRELIKAGIIPPGDVDDRSIKEVSPNDLRGYTQCHFFAGIGGWSIALDLAGWPTTRPVWTGSCPCQPYSSAGKQKGDADERNLWPEFFRLIRECSPVTIFGEQVKNAIRHGWLDGISADLESAGYTCGAAVLGAHSVGAPHIRQRLFWVADASCTRDRWTRGIQRPEKSFKTVSSRAPEDAIECGGDFWLADPNSNGWNERRAECQGFERREALERASGDSGVGDADKERLQGGSCERMDTERRKNKERQVGLSSDSFWSDSILIPCADGKARRIKPGLEPLVDGLPGRASLLRGYGNAIVPQVAAEFIRAFMDCE